MATPIHSNALAPLSHFVVLILGIGILKALVQVRHPP